MSWRSRAPFAHRLHRLALIAGLLTAIGSPASVAGHAILRSSDPVDGSAVTQPPAAIRLTFTEAVQPELSRFEVIDGAGRAVGIASVTTASGDRTTIVLRLPPLANDAYRVRWRVVSNQDLHGSLGSIVFGVGTTPPAPRPAEVIAANAPSPIEIGLRWLELIGLALLVGGVTVRWFVLRPRDHAGPASTSATAMSARLEGLMFRGAAVAAGAAWLRLADGALSASADGLGRPLDIVTRTDSGLLTITELACLAIALVALVAGRRDAVPRLPWSATVAAAGLGAMLAHAATGHLAALAGPWGATLAASHLVAGSVWTGGLIALAIAVVPRLRDPAADPPGAAEARRAVKRFGWLAAAAVGVLGLSGLAAAGIVVATPAAVASSEYGRLLILKVALFGGLGLIGLANAGGIRGWLQAQTGRLAPSRRRLPLPGLPARVRLEAIMALAVLAVGATLLVVPPARGDAYEPSITSAAPPMAAEQVGDLLLTVEVKPGLPGRNVISIGAFNTRRPAPAAIDRVDVVLRRPDGGSVVEAAVAVDAVGHYELVTDALDAAGNWEVGVVVERAAIPVQRLAVTWPLGAAPIAATSSVSGVMTPLASILMPVAGGALIVFVVGYALAAQLALAGRSRGRTMSRIRAQLHAAGTGR